MDEFVDELFALVARVLGSDVFVLDGNYSLTNCKQKYFKN